MGNMCNQLSCINEPIIFFGLGFNQLYLACRREPAESKRWKIMAELGIFLARCLMKHLRVWNEEVLQNYLIRPFSLYEIIIMFPPRKLSRGVHDEKLKYATTLWKLQILNAILSKNQKRPSLSLPHDSYSLPMHQHLPFVKKKKTLMFLLTTRKTEEREERGQFVLRWGGGWMRNTRLSDEENGALCSRDNYVDGYMLCSQVTQHSSLSVISHLFEYCVHS